MDIQKLKDSLNTKILGKEILSFDRVDSTQRYAKRIIDNGRAKDGGVIVAGGQTDGYGRCGRKWFSPPGGLWFSAILKKEMPVKDIGRLVPLLALSIVEMLENTADIKAFIKWPNDILVKDKKIAGSIVETIVKDNRIEWIIFGIGINVNNAIPKELAGNAVSLKEVIGKESDLMPLLSFLICSIESKYMDFLNDKCGSCLDKYRGKSMLLGKNVKVTQGEEVYSGMAEDVDIEGRLILKTNDGKVIRVIAADSVVF